MKYLSFSGLAKRQEYWAVTLLTFFVGWILYVASLIPAAIVAIASPLTAGILILALTVGWLVISVWLVLATTVRRCRDADISVFWTLLWLIPAINFWWWIVAGVLPSHDKSFISDDKT